MAIQVYRPTDPLAEMSTFDVMPKALELATKLAATEFVPVALRNRPAAIMACILAGHEVGLPPMASLQHVDVIDGRPTLRAAAQRALILAQGHKIWIEEQTITRAVVCSQRRGEERIATTTWTIDDAKRAGLLNRTAWQRYPRNMLVARATGDNARGNFMDVLGGIPYNTEEAQDRVDEAPASGREATVAPTGTVRRRARGQATAATAAEPPPAPEPNAEEAQTPPPADEGPPLPEEDLPPVPLDTSAAESTGGESMTLAQQVAMVCREADIDRTVLIEAVTGKTRARDLTRPEAMDVLEKARAIARGEARLEQRDDSWVLLPCQPEQEHLL